MSRWPLRHCQCWSHHILYRLNFAHRSRLVTRDVVCLSLLTTSQRGEHDIDEELVFSNHTGYVFHDSCGIECGATEEVNILKKFIQSKASADRLRSRLHAIWFGLFCVNDDN